MAISSLFILAGGPVRTSPCNGEITKMYTLPWEVLHENHLKILIGSNDIEYFVR